MDRVPPEQAVSVYRACDKTTKSRKQAQQAGKLQAARHKRLQQHKRFLQNLQDSAKEQKLQQALHDQRQVRKRDRLAAKILGHPVYCAAQQLASSGEAEAQPLPSNTAAASATGTQAESVAPSLAQASAPAVAAPVARGRRSRSSECAAAAAPPKRSVSLPAGTPTALFAHSSTAGGAGASMLQRMAEYQAWRRRRRIPDGTPVFCMGGSGRHSGAHARLVAFPVPCHESS